MSADNRSGRSPGLERLGDAALDGSLRTAAGHRARRRRLHGGSARGLEARRGGAGGGAVVRGASLGSFYVEAFSLNAIAEAKLPKSLYTGGDAVLTSGSIDNGGVESGGHVSISSGYVGGDIDSGSSLEGTYGTVDGDVALVGVDNSMLSIIGSLSEGAAFEPTLDLEDLGVHFELVSATAAALAPTASSNIVYGEIQIELSSGENVVELSGDDLRDSWGLHIDGPADAELIINVADTYVESDSLVWTYSGGTSAKTTLLNLHAAETLELSGGNHHVSILAPFADTTFTPGLVTGTLVVGSLLGGGQVNTEPYEGGADCGKGPGSGPL